MRVNIKSIFICFTIIMIMIIPDVVKAEVVCTPATKQKYSGYGFIATSKSNQYITGVEYKCAFGNGKRGEFFVVNEDKNYLYLIYEYSGSFVYRLNAVEKLKSMTKEWTNFNSIMLPPYKWEIFGISNSKAGCSGIKAENKIVDCKLKYIRNYYNSIKSAAKTKGIDTSITTKNFMVVNQPNFTKYYKYNSVKNVYSFVSDKLNYYEVKYEVKMKYLTDYYVEGENKQVFVVNFDGVPLLFSSVITSDYGRAEDSVTTVRPVVKISKNKVAKLSDNIPTNSNQYLVTFNTNYGSAIESQIINKGSVAKKPDNPTKTGYNFVGWYSDSALTKSYDFSTKVTSNITLYAKYNPITYTVKFNSNGGSSIVDQIIVSGGKTVNNQPTRKGYNFVGWYSDSALTKSYDFSSKVTSNITLYAKWNEAKYNYTVTFNSNDGSTVASQTVEGGEKVQRPTAPTKEGYKFGGWYLDSTLTKVYNFNAPVAGNMTLYAKWIENDKTTYTVTFDANGGSGEMDPFIVEENASYTLPENEFKAPTNKKFNGWLVVDEMKKQGESITVTSNIIVKAQWTDIVPTTYTVTFNSNGGNEVDPETVISGNAISKPENPIKEGYSFENWYLDENLTLLFNFKIPIDKNITLYAKWNEVSQVNKEEQEIFTDVSNILNLIDHIYEEESINFQSASKREAISYWVNSAVSLDGDIISYGVFADREDSNFMWTEETNLAKEATFEVSKLESSSKKYKELSTKINKRLNNKVKNIMVYDLNVKLNNEIVQPNGESYVYLAIPNDWNSENMIVYRQETDGKLTKLESEVSNGYILFKTEHFSNYAIVEHNYEGAVVESDDNPSTGATISITIILGSIITILLIGYFVKKKKLLYRV